MTEDDIADVEIAAAYLSRVAEPGNSAIFRLVCERGYVNAARDIRRQAVPDDVRAATAPRYRRADPVADLEAASRTGIQLLTPAHPGWPHFAFAAFHSWMKRHRPKGTIALNEPGASDEVVGRDVMTPPLALWVQGDFDLTPTGIRSIAVVGSRAATAYGDHVASDFGYSLACSDVQVISGGAYGIDAAAARGALAADGRTVLVSAGGLDRPYPSGNSKLYERTLEHGSLISEHPPGSSPRRHRFLSRNRIIAALGSAVLVVEAAARSGALNTARCARELGRPVLGVPGPVTSALSVGVHELLRRDDLPAHLVTSAADVLAYCASPD
jgi:DNA processing protein